MTVIHILFTKKFVSEIAAKRAHFATFLYAVSYSPFWARFSARYGKILNGNIRRLLSAPNVWSWRAHKAGQKKKNGFMSKTNYWIRLFGNQIRMFFPSPRPHARAYVVLYFGYTHVHVSDITQWIFTELKQTHRAHSLLQQKERPKKTRRILNTMQIPRAKVPETNCEWAA